MDIHSSYAHTIIVHTRPVIRYLELHLTLNVMSTLLDKLKATNWSAQIHLILSCVFFFSSNVAMSSFIFNIVCNICIYLRKFVYITVIRGLTRRGFYLSG